MNCGIEKIGDYLKVDENGYIVNTTSVEDIQSQWKGGVNEVVNAYKTHYKNDLHSVYLRGSVAKGKAIENISDIDTFAIVLLPQKKIERGWIKLFRQDFRSSFPFINGVEIIVSSLEGFEERRGQRILIKTQSICLYGVNLAEDIPNLKPGLETIQHLPNLEKEIAGSLKLLNEKQSEEKIKDKCTWIMKRILRGGFELVMGRSKKYTRDLYPCYKDFSKYYPEMKAEMYKVLELAICPTNNINRINTTLSIIGTFVIAEYKKLD